MSHIYRLLHWGPITALSIIFILFASAVLADIAWYPPSSTGGALHLAIFCSWVFMILRNFFKAAFDGPGLVPIGWRPEAVEDEQNLQYCNFCKGFKTPRSHHCRKCERCVMKMDHHCPWINNCVGHKNHKSFTLFLTFVVIGCTHAAVLITCCCLQHLFWDEGFIIIKIFEQDLVSFGESYLICFCLAIGLSIGVAIAVSMLLYYQVKTILTNQTGIETWIVAKADRERYDEAEFVYPYDLGAWNNIKQVINWSQDYVGDGIVWPVVDGCNQYTLTKEQLEQKALKRDRMILHKIVSDYNGTWCPCRYGFSVCYNMPWTDDPRMKVEKNDAVYVTRWRKQWLFGEKLRTTNSTNDPDKYSKDKGWFPRNCALEVYDDEDEFLKKLK